MRAKRSVPLDGLRERMAGDFDPIVIRGTDERPVYASWMLPEDTGIDPAPITWWMLDGDDLVEVVYVSTDPGRRGAPGSWEPVT